MGHSSVVSSTLYAETPFSTFTWHVRSSPYVTVTTGVAGSAQCVLNRRVAVLDRPEPPVTVSVIR